MNNSLAVLALTSLVACQAGLPPAPAVSDPSDASNVPAAWVPPPSPFEGSAFSEDQLDTKDPHAGHKGHGMPASEDEHQGHSKHGGDSQ